MSPWLAARLGYDPHRVAELRPEFQRALALVALASVPAVLLLSTAAGYGAWLASDSKVLSALVGLGAGLYLLNLLRVAVAGGGIGPQQTMADITHWRPRSVPLVMLALLGMFFAQPLILGLLAGAQDPQIEELRQSLTAMHADAVLRAVREEKAQAEAALATAQRRVTARTKVLEARQRELAALSAGQQGGRPYLERALADDRQDLDRQQAQVTHGTATLQRALDREAQVQAVEVEPYQRHLARSHFLLRRVQLTWDHPLRPALLSLAMVVLMVFPWVLSGSIARTASRAYEAGRWKMNRALIDAAYREARQLEEQALKQWPAFVGLRLELHEDAPYNTRPRAGAGLFEARHG